ncbi:GNAT family N-acetyltransferase [Lachnospiraceae bacterium MD1]|uniref:GNAT family N-acetyltransferase n=1 Tax=Variimorphobacter saccharofermentans TaxID=2755051 RepID=A0A839K2E2_9FIRM|nr:GNAT family N-acetyltransferase [Variimorphobacter saccharofermentans]MBB2184083.1 GNAT family N-acetyltransferase [Variimorphobacter saccharofermentans]
MQLVQIRSQDVKVYQEPMIKLMKQSYRLSFPDITISEEYFQQRLQLLESYLELDHAIVYAAVNRYELQGFIWFYVRESMGDKVIHIVHFVVDEEARQQGIGRKLIELVEDYALEHQILELELLVTRNNETAVEYYKKRNFEIERLIMRKRLVTY